jgi:hypothetical protein
MLHQPTKKKQPTTRWGQEYRMDQQRRPEKEEKTTQDEWN